MHEMGETCDGADACLSISSRGSKHSVQTLKSVFKAEYAFPTQLLGPQPYSLYGFRDPVALCGLVAMTAAGSRAIWRLATLAYCS